jgi:2-(1,2-epoxy-1,2-dihydrophenyl)acetyl-CoA isomerase
MPDATEPPPVVVERDRAVATITMRIAALTGAAKDALRDAVTEAADDPDIRAILLTGEGRVFCAGQDLGEHAAVLDSDDPGRAFDSLDEHYHPVIRGLINAPKPVVVAVNGACAGAGLSLAMAGDIRLASDTAKFTTAFIGIGLTFDSGLSATLARAVGAARASELVLLAEPFTAEQARVWGIVGRVVPAADLLADARSVASRLAAGPTLAYAAAKAAIRNAWASPIDDVLDAEAEAQRRLGLTADHRSAVASFLAKERPTFEGR